MIIKHEKDNTDSVRIQQSKRKPVLWEQLPNRVHYALHIMGIEVFDMAAELRCGIKGQGNFIAARCTV